MSSERSVKDVSGLYNVIYGAGDGNRTHVRSLGSFYTAIVRRPLTFQLADYTPLSDSRLSVLIIPVFQNWAKRFLLENIDFLPVGGNFISPLRPETRVGAQGFDCWSWSRTEAREASDERISGAVVRNQ